MKYYIADSHFAHANIIHHSLRPFSTVEEMDDKMIENWNSVVGKQDEIYIVGDLIYRSTNPRKYLEALNGGKHLIKGNHDIYLKDRSLWKYFESIQDIKFVQDENTNLVLFHYPMAEWPGYYRNHVLLFGHIHNNDNEAKRIMDGLKNCYNVGVDMPYMDFTPRTFKQIVAGAAK